MYLYDPVSRRCFIRGLGGFMLAVPFLPSLLPKAVAATPQEGLGFVGLQSVFGVFRHLFWPDQGANIALAPDIKYRPLGTENFSDIIHNDHWSDLKSKMLIIRGLDMSFRLNHNRCEMLSAGSHPGTSKYNQSSSHETIDNVLSKSSKFYKNGAPDIPVLRQGVGREPRGDKPGTPSFRKLNASDSRAEPILPMRDIDTVFTKVLSGLSSTSGTSTNTEDTDKKKAVDLVYNEYSKVMNSSRISAADKVRLDTHMTYLSEIQRRLDSVSTAPTKTCEAPDKPQRSDSDEVNFKSLSQAEIDDLARAHMDILVLGMMCGKTRIGTVNLDTIPFESHGDYHDPVSHQPYNSDNTPRNLRYNKWCGKQVAYLIRTMDQIQESNGKSLLDNSLVMWSNEFGGYHYNHNNQELPVVLAGSFGGFFNTGRYLDYRNSKDVGRLYNQLIVTILQAAGLSPSDYEVNGQAGYGDYRINNFGYVMEKRNDHHKTFMDTTTKRSILPHI